MSAPDKFLYEYAVIRYVPRVDREEFINIGLVMMSKRNKWLKAMVKFDEKRIKALYPSADIECLKRQCRLFEIKDVPSKDIPVEEKYRWLVAVKSACLQVSPSHPGMIFPPDDWKTGASEIDLMENEFGRLFNSLVSNP